MADLTPLNLSELWLETVLILAHFQAISIQKTKLGFAVYKLC